MVGSECPAAMHRLWEMVRRAGRESLQPRLRCKTRGATGQGAVRTRTFPSTRNARHPRQRRALACRTIRTVARMSCARMPKYWRIAPLGNGAANGDENDEPVEQGQ